jgi:hypothetical protein
MSDKDKKDIKEEKVLPDLFTVWLILKSQRGQLFPPELIAITSTLNKAENLMNTRANELVEEGRHFLIYINSAEINTEDGVSCETDNSIKCIEK